MNLPDLSNLAPLAGYAGMTAAVAAVATFWRQIQGFITGLFTWFIVSGGYEPSIGIRVVWYLRKTSKEFRRGSNYYSMGHRYIRVHKRWGHVAYEMGGSGKIFLYRGWIPVVVTSTNMDPRSRDSQKQGGFTISSIRWLVDIEKVIFEAMESHMDYTKEMSSGRHYIRRMTGYNDGNKGAIAEGNSEDEKDFRYLGYTAEELGPPSPAKPFSHLAYDDKVMEIVRVCRRWMESKDWYEARNIAWRMGMLFTGLPGTGKTSMARAIAQELGLPVFMFDLTEMNNSHLVEAWHKAKECAPCMVLLEDIDRTSVAIKDGSAGADTTATIQTQHAGDVYKDSMKRWSPLTLDCLLNCISGIEPSDGILVVATANDYSKLDTALGVPEPGGKSSRPGRLDFHVEFPTLDLEGRRQVAMRVLAPAAADVTSAVLVKAEELAAAGEGETGAQFTKRCVDAALSDYWKKEAA